MSGDVASLSESDGAASSSRPAGSSRFRRTRRVVRTLVFSVGILAILTALFILTPITSTIYYAMDAQDELAPSDFIICLGGDASRIIESARLLQEGYAPTMIVTNHDGAAVRMREQAIEWGAPPDRVLTEATSTCTNDHPEAVAELAGIDIAHDRCIIVTSYTHLLRARAVFEKAGYRNIIMQEPRWERQARDWNGISWRGRFLIFPKLVYEGAGWALYWVRGDV